MEEEEFVARLNRQSVILSDEKKKKKKKKKRTTFALRNAACVFSVATTSKSRYTVHA